jgi:hypothetical protein
MEPRGSFLCAAESVCLWSVRNITGLLTLYGNRSPEGVSRAEFRNVVYISGAVQHECNAT